MNEPLTPEQQRQLDSWASQRDGILLDIANKKTENESLTVTNKNLAASNTEIADKIQQSIGRLEELEKREQAQATLTTSENAVLVSEKSILQTENFALKEENRCLEENKESRLSDIAILTDIHDKVFERINGLESIIGGIVTISSQNATEIVNLLIAAGGELKKIIDINRQNVVETNVVINKLPKIIFELQRDILERKELNKNKIKTI